MFLNLRTRKVGVQKPDLGVEFQEIPSLEGFQAKTWRKEECDWCIFFPNQLDYSVMPGVYTEPCAACGGFGWNWKVVGENP